MGVYSFRMEGIHPRISKETFREGRRRRRLPVPRRCPKGAGSLLPLLRPFPARHPKGASFAPSGQFASALPWAAAGTLSFPPGPFLKRRKGGALRSPRWNPPGGWNRRRGQRRKAGLPPAIPSLRCRGRRGRGEPDSPEPALAADALRGGRRPAPPGIPAVSASGRVPAAGQCTRHSFQKPKSVPGFGASVMGIVPCGGRGSRRRGTEIRPGLPEVPGEPLPPRTRKDRPAGRSFLLSWAAQSSSRDWAARTFRCSISWSFRTAAAWAAVS